MNLLNYTQYPINNSNMKKSQIKFVYYSIYKKQKERIKIIYFTDLTSGQ